MIGRKKVKTHANTLLHFYRILQKNDDITYVSFKFATVNLLINT